MPFLASDFSGMIWIVAAEGLYWLVCLACLVGLILACFRPLRRAAGIIGHISGVNLLSCIGLVFGLGGGISFSGPLTADVYLFIFGLTAPPLAAALLMLVGRSKKNKAPGI